MSSFLSASSGEFQRHNILYINFRNPTDASSYVSNSKAMHRRYWTTSTISRRKASYNSSRNQHCRSCYGYSVVSTPNLYYSTVYGTPFLNPYYMINITFTAIRNYTPNQTLSTRNASTMKIKALAINTVFFRLAKVREYALAWDLEWCKARRD